MILKWPILWGRCPSGSIANTCKCPVTATLSNPRPLNQCTLPFPWAMPSSTHILGHACFSNSDLYYPYLYDTCLIFRLANGSHIHKRMFALNHGASDIYESMSSVFPLSKIHVMLNHTSLGPRWKGHRFQQIHGHIGFKCHQNHKMLSNMMVI